MEMLQPSDPRTEIVEKSKTFDLGAPLTDEEFDDALDYVAATLLFDTQWDGLVLANPKIRRQFPVIDDVALICKVEECPYAQKCPVLKAMKPSDRSKLLGTECRADREFGIRVFTAQVRELSIAPESFTDIMSVAAIVRLYITNRRIDWHIALDTPIDLVPGVVDQRTSKIYWKKEAHPLYKIYLDNAKQIKSLQEGLLASRKDRAAFAAAMGKAGTALTDLLSGKRLDSIDIPLDADFEDVE
jgi:hypothetical protein